MRITHLFRTPALSATHTAALLSKVRNRVSDRIHQIDTEMCFNIAAETIEDTELDTLRWLLAETFEPQSYGATSFLNSSQGHLFEVGPRLSFSTAWSTNAVTVCHACGLGRINRIERSRRYLVHSSEPLTIKQQSNFLDLVHDRMTETRYDQPLLSFEPKVTPAPVVEIPVLTEGRGALEKINREMGLAFDEWDLDYYTKLFSETIGRNPTTVECFDIAQSNSEHSRHWFFKGRLIIDGEEAETDLFSMVQQTLKANPRNSTIAFKDNSSAIRGVEIATILPSEIGAPSPFVEKTVDMDVLFTAETHNFPSGVAPFPGAETGTGGRIRDTHATGRGSLVVAGTAAYCVGNLHIPSHHLPWEDKSFTYPESLASPLDIEIEASNGASDYGNKFGEPVIQGYTRSFGMRLPDGERREWIKPIMFSGGIGQINHQHSNKGQPEISMFVVKIGGPAYRIGMGGGAASSMVQGSMISDLDFNAVQRGDAEMAQKVNRVIRACVELGDANPIVSIHDQGAGGNCNVLKEIIEPKGAIIEIRDIPVGDKTLSVLEIWGAEYQENDALLIRPQHKALFESLAMREHAPFAIVGHITGDGRIVVHDTIDNSTPVNLELEHVLGSMPQKTFEYRRSERLTQTLRLPPNLDVQQALDRVLTLLAVGSKRFLTTKVDRSVTGLVARQQCAGPLHLTVSDVGVIAQSHFATTGGATAIGEQPIKGLLDPASMARLSVGEALTNLVWARITDIEDIRCSANWMWAAKLDGEGAALHDAAVAMRDFMIDLGIAVDGGKDSLSMAAEAHTADGGTETVKAPPALVISAYATCPNIELTVTPDLELQDEGRLLFIDLGGGRDRLGGSALAQVFGQLGDEQPDIEDPALLRRAFEAIQNLLEERQITAGHDRSDGGLITTLLEMAFAGDCGLDIDLPMCPDADPLHALFSEELGLVFEVPAAIAETIRLRLNADDIPCVDIGRGTREKSISIKIGGQKVLSEKMVILRDRWESTSFALDRLQADPSSVDAECDGLKSRHEPAWSLSFTPKRTGSCESKIPVAILREEGSNGDREMASAFHAAGMQAWDVTMSDLLEGRIELERFRGLVAVGGFSFADVLDSAKGWAGGIRFNNDLRQQFDAFYQRPDTFSLGVCNGCQLLALLGWVPFRDINDHEQPRFIHNASGRFESRFSTVTILDSPSIMLRGMQGSTLGIWVAHGEGRALFSHQKHLDTVLTSGLAPLRYADDDGQPTEIYPFNPNGSPEGIAALCSPDGRHLAMMPHPERAFLKWQWPWMPRQWRHELEASPWIKLFQNAEEWCRSSPG